jgi:hypothetical protein
MKRDKTSKSTKATMRHASKQKAADWAKNHQISKCGGIDAESHADAKIERNHDYQHQEEKDKYYNSLVVQMLKKEEKNVYESMIKINLYKEALSKLDK